MRIPRITSAIGSGLGINSHRGKEFVWRRATGATEHTTDTREHDQRRGAYYVYRGVSPGGRLADHAQFLLPEGRNRHGREIQAWMHLLRSGFLRDSEVTVGARHYRSIRIFGFLDTFVEAVAGAW